MKKKTLNRETTEEKMKLRIKSLIWNMRKKKTSNQCTKKKKRIQKIEDSIRSLWDNFKCSNICIIGVPEGEEKEEEIGNLSEKSNERKLPFCFGEGNRHTSPGSTECPKQYGCKEDHTKTHHN